MRVIAIANDGVQQRAQQPFRRFPFRRQNRELRNIPEARRLLVLHHISGVNGPGLMPKVVHRFTLRHTGIIVEELRRP
jgi:hypothetical protein